MEVCFRQKAKAKLARRGLKGDRQHSMRGGCGGARRRRQGRAGASATCGLLGPGERAQSLMGEQIHAERSMGFQFLPTSLSPVLPRDMLKGAGPGLVEWWVGRLLECCTLSDGHHRSDARAVCGSEKPQHSRARWCQGRAVRWASGHTLALPWALAASVSASVRRVHQWCRPRGRVAGLVWRSGVYSRSHVPGARHYQQQATCQSVCLTGLAVVNMEEAEFRGVGWSSVLEPECLGGVVLLGGE